MTNGLLVSFEGIDGSGKTTQARRFCEHLRALGHAVTMLREPGGTPIGERIRDILLDTGSTGMVHTAELFLYLAARAQISAQVIQPALDNGGIVVMDRFIDSTTAYQGYARGLDIEEIGRMNLFATDGLVPAVTYVIDCPPDVAASRLTGTPDRLESEGMMFMERVREGFLDIAARETERLILIDGALPEDDVALLVRSHFEKQITLS